MILKTLLTFGVVSLVLTSLPTARSYNILAVYPFPSKSHYGMHRVLIKELIEHGHKVTMVAAFSLDNQNLGSNYTEVLIDGPYDFWGDFKEAFGTVSLFDLTKFSFAKIVQMLDIMGVTTTEHALKQPNVQELINAKHTEGVFDLLLTEQFHQEPILILAKIYNIPVIATSTLGALNYINQLTGIISPWSYMPNGFLPFTDKMSFWERIENTLTLLYENYYREFIYFPKMDKMVQKYFSHLQIELPKVSELQKNISAILINSHVPLTTARPYALSTIQVGGMHIYPPKKLPTDIQQFLDGATNGAIYLSFGSNVQSNDMPVEMLQMFVRVFGGLKQRILMKFEDDSLKNVPSNVMIKKWMPQSDILAHPNIKVFITHGGLFGTQEGVHYAVPMLGIPFYCDQHLNINKAVQSGYAIKLHFQDITEQILSDSLRELMENKKYKENIQKISDIFRDRPLNARDMAIYWIEYVIRHKGAPHLRNAGLDLKWYQLYLLDIIGLFIGGIIVVLLLVKFLLRRVFTKVKNSKKLKSQ